MTDPYAQVNIKILEKEYQISCPASERAALLDSAEMLNRKISPIVDVEIEDYLSHKPLNFRATTPSAHNP